MEGTFEIKGREYLYWTNEKQAKVKGQTRSQNGRLLPGLVDAVVAELRGAGFPAHGDYEIATEHTLLFNASPTVACGWICEEFAAKVRTEPFHAEWTEKAREHVRRTSLARKVGLAVSDREYYARRRSLETEWRRRALKCWAWYEHPWKHLVEGMPLNEYSWYWQEHRWRNQKARPEDLGWLEGQVAGVEARIVNLEVEG